MNVTPAQVQKVLAGNYSFSQLGFSMLITRLKGVYLKNSSPATLQSCVNEINAFFQKYGAIMVSDFAIISKL
ncbi:MAG: hypothetical protein LBR98_00300 [Syntrophomonadaceae bacterium]|jgi:hypothetical protein|nr:hypothetical protein [Syntrophomonadaceae bacterium]